MDDLCKEDFKVVSFTPGTRSLHAVASKYDIGIYFEADGRGGILFFENYLLWLEAKTDELLSSKRLMNTTVPDALASLLLVEAILQQNGWSLRKWNEIYCDLANRELNEVELVEKIVVATANPKTVAVSHSETKEEADTLIENGLGFFQSYTPTLMEECSRGRSRCRSEGRDRVDKLGGDDREVARFASRICKLGLSIWLRRRPRRRTQKSVEPALLDPNRAKRGWWTVVVACESAATQGE